MNKDPDERPPALRWLTERRAFYLAALLWAVGMWLGLRQYF